MLVLGAIGVGTHNALAYLGLNYTTATNGVILNSFIPVMIIAFSWLFLRGAAVRRCNSRASACRWSACSRSCRGEASTCSTTFRLNGGDLLVILSMAMWSIYTIGAALASRRACTC